MIIPRFSQDKEHLLLELPETEAEYWSTRACGIICVRMAIAALTGTVVPLRELIAFARDTYHFIDYTKSEGGERALPLFSDASGWLNYGLIKTVAKAYGVFWRWCIDSDHAALLLEIERQLDAGTVVVASIRTNFDPKRGSHLVIVASIDSEQQTIHLITPDAETWGDIIVSFEKFLSTFSGRILVFSAKDSEEFRSLSPIFIERTGDLASSIALCHLHGNEIPAMLHARKFANEHGLAYFWLVQNSERFLRFATWAPERHTDATQFARLDANRIFSLEWLKLTVNTLNRGHMTDEKNIEDIITKGSRIAHTYIDAIKDHDTWIAVHNNFSSSEEYAQHGNFFGMKTIPPITSFLTINTYIEKSITHHAGSSFPKNAFILVNHRADFEVLKQRDFNVALVSWHDEVGSLGEAADSHGKRYFCIETGYEDDASREAILQTILRLVK